MVSIEGNELWYIIRCPLRVTWIIIENIFGLIFFVSALVICRPILYIAPRLYWKIDEHLVWLGMHYVSYWMHSAVGKVVIYGDNLEGYTSEPCLVVVNHQSDADPLMLMVACRRLESLYGRLSVVLEDIFRCTHFGVMMRFRGDFFIHQGRDMRHMQSRLIEDNIRRYERLRDPRWCVLFPEGGFLGKRKVQNDEYAKKNGYPILNNVLLPRLGALQALMNVEQSSVSCNHAVANGDAFHPLQKARPYYRRIIDVTIGYPDRKPITLSGMLLALSPISQVAIHFRVRNIDHLIGCQQDQLRTLIYDLWIEKDKLLQGFYDTGSFPGQGIEDHLPVDYLCYLRSYAVALPVLKLYTFFVSTGFRYVASICSLALQVLRFAIWKDQSR